MMYYVSRKKSKSRKVIERSEEATDKYQSRSRSRKEKTGHHNANTCDLYRDCRKSVDLRDQSKLIRPKESILRVNKKKSNSTKSILSKNFGVKKDKVPEAEPKREKKVVPHKSKVSKRS